MVYLRWAQHTYTYKGETWSELVCAELGQIKLGHLRNRLDHTFPHQLYLNVLLSYFGYFSAYRCPSLWVKVLDIWKTKYVIFTVFKWHFYAKPFALQMTVIFPPWRLTVLAMWLILKILVLESLRPWYLVLETDTIWLSDQSLANNWHPQGWCRGWMC